MSDEPSPLTDFTGVARLFPLPNLVFFPHVMQPLHIFEPRYRQMTADALEGDRLLALVKLQDDWEKDYDGKPAVHPVACLGKIVAEQNLEDGRYNLLLRGLSRVRILHELPTAQLFRSAEVAVLSDVEAPKLARKALRKRLTAAMAVWFPNKGELYEQLAKVLQSKLPLGALADLLTFALPLSPDLKQLQLEEIHVERRIERLLEHVTPEQPAPEGRKFPPDFSPN